jgi:hypothetical protein
MLIHSTVYQIINYELALYVAINSVIVAYALP